LVFSTVHTNDSAGAVTRLVEMGVEPFLVSSSLMAVMAQRLVRRVCLECREPHEPTDEEIAKLGMSRDRFQALGGGTTYRARGCSACSRSGYRGRTGIYELLVIDDDIRQLVLKNVDSSTIKKKAMEKGMLTLLDDGALKVANGVTTIAEVLSVTQEDL
jgi:general secretion pathway protein E